MDEELLKRLSELTELDILRAVDAMPLEKVVAVWALRVLRPEALAEAVLEYHEERPHAPE